MTPGRIGLSPSETKAWSTWLSIGRRSPARSITREDEPATAHPTLPAAMNPRVVSTPRQTPSSIRNPVTSQFCTMSTPRAIGRARVAPGHRVVAHGAAAALHQPAEDGEPRVVEVEELGASARTWSASSSSASAPCRIMALPRRR